MGSELNNITTSAGDTVCVCVCVGGGGGVLFGKPGILR